MSNEHANRASMSIGETTISTMWEIVGIVEVLERTSLYTKQDLTENTIIDDILELLSKHGLTLYQSLSLLAGC
jgi:hypothetical protein